MKIDKIDTSKAFDTVNHEILFKKLNFIGVPVDCATWFEDSKENNLSILVKMKVRRKMLPVVYHRDLFSVPAFS